MFKKALQKLEEYEALAQKHTDKLTFGVRDSPAQIASKMYSGILDCIFLLDGNEKVLEECLTAALKKCNYRKRGWQEDVVSADHADEVGRTLKGLALLVKKVL